MEFATRRFPGKFVKGLIKYIEEDGGLGNAELRLWRSIKDARCRLFVPDIVVFKTLRKKAESEGRVRKISTFVTRHYVIYLEIGAILLILIILST